MRVVRRPGIRSRLLPQPPAAEVPLGAGRPFCPSRLLYLAKQGVPRKHFLRRRRGAHGIAPARTAARPCGRQVAGGIFDRGAAEGDGAARSALAVEGAAGDSFRDRSRMARIVDVKGRRVWDSRGRPTVEAEVAVGRGTTRLATGRAIAPAGASTGSGEA